MKNFCSQCGQKLTDRACGFTHAILKEEMVTGRRAYFSPPPITDPAEIDHFLDDLVEESLRACEESGA